MNRNRGAKKLPSDLFSGLPEQARAQARKATQPEWIEPMLATLTDQRFSRAGWLFEPKLDGVRCLAFYRAGQVRLCSRNQKRQDEKYPEIVQAMKTRYAVP